MLKFLYDRAAVVGVSLSFFTFGFYLAANLYDLSFQETMTGLLAGAVCGATILMIEVLNSMRAQRADSRTAMPASGIEAPR